MKNKHSKNIYTHTTLTINKTIYCENNTNLYSTITNIYVMVTMSLVNKTKNGIAQEQT